MTLIKWTTRQSSINNIQTKGIDIFILSKGLSIKDKTR